MKRAMPDMVACLNTRRCRLDCFSAFRLWHKSIWRRGNHKIFYSLRWEWWSNNSKIYQKRKVRRKDIFKRETEFQICNMWQTHWVIKWSHWVDIWIHGSGVQVMSQKWMELFMTLKLNTHSSVDTFGIGLVTLMQRVKEGRKNDLSQVAFASFSSVSS